MTYIKARPTTYKGIRMRSRLEAAYAQSLDTNQNPKTWEYEPRAFGSVNGQYLPDFWVIDDRWPEKGVYVEVKPKVADFGMALERMHIILDSEPQASLVVATSTDYENWDIPISCSPLRGCGQCKRGRKGGLSDLMRDQYTITCGHCGFWNTHLIDTMTQKRAACCDSHATELLLECEGCSFHTHINIHTHKGDTYAAFKTSPAPVGDDQAAPTN